jgi:N-glycosidase YbiA
MAIKGFSGQYRFLSNFYPSMIYKYPTVEHFYQAMKTHDQELRSRIAACTTPGEAKRMGRNLDLRKDWEDIKNDVMHLGLRIKFSDSALATRLLATGDEYLEETNTWGDTYWGVCDNVGLNMLGKLLMLLREELQSGVVGDWWTK